MLPVLWHTSRFSQVIEDMNSDRACGFQTEVFANSGHLLTKMLSPSVKPDVVLIDFKDSVSCDASWDSFRSENVIWSFENQMRATGSNSFVHRAEGDFVTWPVDPGELRLRIEKVLSRKKRLLTSFANFLDGLEEDLTGKELRILRHFVNAKDQALSRDELMHAFWPNKSVHPKTLDVQIFNLRKKLQKAEMAIRYRPAERDWQFLTKKTGLLR